MHRTVFNTYCLAVQCFTAEPPRKDVGELRKSEAFLKEFSRAYAVNPVAQETQGHPFVAKHFNVIDPLRENNNLGRSVSKGALLFQIFWYNTYCYS